jgi:hypothetical protein
VSWGARFDDPITLANVRKLLTLQDAATYITNLPKKESDLPEWQTAIEALKLNRRMVLLSQENKTTSYTLPSRTEDGHCTKILSIEQYSFFGDPHDAVAGSELFLKFLRYMMTSIPIGIQMKLR